MNESQLEQNKIITQELKQNKYKVFHQQLQNTISKILHLPKNYLCQPCTIYCQHQHNCLYESIIQAGKSFIIVYGLKSSFELIIFLLKLKRLQNFKQVLIMLVKQILNFENFQAAMFPATYSFILKTSTCFFRKLFNSNRGVLHFLVGVLAAMSSMSFLNQDRRKFICVFLLSRAIDIFYTHLVRKQIIPKIKYDYIIFFSIYNLITGYAYGVEPQICPQSLVKFYKKFSNWSTREHQLRLIWIGIKQNELSQKGII